MMNSITKHNQLPINRRLLSLNFLYSILTIMAIVFSSNYLAQDAAIENLRMTGKAFASVAKKASPAVVFIQVEKTITEGAASEYSSPFGRKQSPFNDDFFKRFFGPSFPQRNKRSFPKSQPPQQKSMGQGSGFIISTDGYILTNNHVVENADKISVKLEDGRTFIATTVGTDPHSDVALIKIDSTNLPIMTLGDSDILEVGEWVLAIGNPFGLSHTLTAGIVSAKGRSSIGIADYENFIQTDAAINPGNSGGPLVNLDGQAVGINTAIFSRSGGYMGIGFAIPINMVKLIKDQLLANGRVIRGYLGIIIQELSPELAKSFNLESHQGILISEVTENSPASKAGLKQGDVIIKFNNKAVKDVGTFRNIVSLKKPGTKEKITLLRNGKQRSLSITIGNLSNTNEDTEIVLEQPLEKLGLTVQTLTPEIANQLGYQDEKGVLITKVYQGSIAAQSGLKKGILIQEINHQLIRNTSELKKALSQSEESGTALLRVKDGRYSHYLVLNYGK